MKLNELCLEVTSRCIMNCVHCSTAASQSNDSNEQLSLKVINSIISDFCMLGGSILELSGGEPTLLPFLPEIVSQAKNMGLEVRLYTCGTSGKGDEPLNQNLLKELRNRGLDKIIFNLQGANPRVHDSITRGAGSFNASCKSIQQAKKIGFWVGVHFVPMKPNVTSFKEFLRLARVLLIDEVALLRFVSQGRGKVNETALKLSKKKLWEFLESVALLRQEFNMLQIRTGCPFDFLGFIDQTVKLCSCKAGISTCNITPSGYVIPCPAFKHLDEFKAGELETNTLRDIWTLSEVFNQFRMLDYRQIKICSKCEKIQTCQGRCPAQRVREYGDLLIGPDPDCTFLGMHEQKAAKSSSQAYLENTA